ncbi:type II toxin-antitoxin system HicA family toxin [Sphingomonas bacterium]|uniref:type II toxin-antitoxin system HicA family toxin n=1 Tax=Sphingomonas bacterium TaxID=1895847 RepID=UPI0020C6611C|nr:type II toxin-antitoxin system HicA family toxin [Sphingomonas bacterium]
MRELLAERGCAFLREGKGDHEIWVCPGVSRPVIVDGRIMSRHLANGVLKQAGIKAKV